MTGYLSWFVSATLFIYFSKLQDFSFLPQRINHGNWDEMKSSSNYFHSLIFHGFLFSLSTTSHRMWEEKKITTNAKYLAYDNEKFLELIFTNFTQYFARGTNQFSLKFSTFNCTVHISLSIVVNSCLHCPTVQWKLGIFRFVFQLILLTEHLRIRRRVDFTFGIVSTDLNWCQLHLSLEFSIGLWIKLFRIM